MPNEPETSNLPARIASEFSEIPKALVPRSLKAFDRLIGAAVDIPVAWLNQKKARIDKRTAALGVVDDAIAAAVAKNVATSEEIVAKALNSLVRKEYRKQSNVEAVAAAAIDNLVQETNATEEEAHEAATDVNSDWLNVFEKFSEDASTERMQNLWGRVLAGEIRRPGRFSVRTLRFLSEFSQADALTFAAFAENCFGDIAPLGLVKPPEKKDLRDIIYLEANGLLQGSSSGAGLEFTLTFSIDGIASMKEGALILLFRGSPNDQIRAKAMALTPLGQELLALLPNRDARVAARRVANQMRTPAITSALLGTSGGHANGFFPMEVLWDDSGEELKS